MSEYEFESVRGLPGHLPKGETLLWQGSPEWWPLAQRAFHMRSVALYFAVLMSWRGAAAAMTGSDAITALQSAIGMAPLAVGALGLLAGLAWLTARTTVYTITSKRIVLRYGFALPKAINIPFVIVESATLKSYDDNSGDVAVTLTQPNKMAYLLLWPHARPWKLARPQPSMRAVANAPAVAMQLSNALKSAQGDRGIVHGLTTVETEVPQGALSAA